MNERGQVMPLAGLLVAAMVGVAMIATHVAGAVNVRTQAQTAADAAALAGVEGSEGQARVAAKKNRAELVRFVVNGPVVTAEVELDGYRTDASARLLGGLAESEAEVD